MNELCAAYSQQRNAWCVYRKLSETTMAFKWLCPSQEAAEKLAHEVNNGALICRGTEALRSNCGKCIKCEIAINA